MKGKDLVSAIERNGWREWDVLCSDASGNWDNVALVLVNVPLESSQDGVKWDECALVIMPASTFPPMDRT